AAIALTSALSAHVERLARLSSTRYGNGEETRTDFGSIQAPRYSPLVALVLPWRDIARGFGFQLRCRQVVGEISALYERSIANGDSYDRERHPGTGRLCGIVAIREYSGARARALQEPAARYAGLCGRRAPGGGDGAGRCTCSGASAIEREQRHRRRGGLA